MLFLQGEEEGKGQSLKLPLQGCSQGSGIRPCNKPGSEWKGISLFLNCIRREGDINGHPHNHTYAHTRAQLCTNVKEVRVN